MISYNTRDPLIDRAVLLLDPANTKSYAPNVFPNPGDIYAWASPAGSTGTLARDTTTGKSPAGGTPMLMTSTSAAQPFIYTENLAAYELAPAQVGQTWTISVYVKASSTCTVSADIFGHGANQSYINIDGAGGSDIGGLAQTVTTAWTRISYTRTFMNTSVKYIAIRLDGSTNGVSGTQIWWDGLQVEQNSAATAYSSTVNTTGSTFKDLSSNALTATRYGAVPFSTDGGGCWDFSSNTNSQANLASLGFVMPSDPIPVNGNFVIAAWVKNPSTVGGGGQPAIFSNAGGGDGYRFGAYSAGIYALGGYPYTEGVSTCSFTANVWYHTCVVFDRMGLDTGQARLTFYLNAVPIGYMNLVTPQIAMTSVVPGIVKNTFGTNTYNGKLGILAAYKGHATPAEVQLLFASQRGRYGV
jgi:hypothetical protein